MNRLRSARIVVIPFLAGWLLVAPGAYPEQAERPLSALAEEASSAYAKGEWKTAIANYQRLLDAGVSDAALYYNLGMAYARDGEKGRGILMLLKARRLAPRDPDIHANLEILAPETLSQIALFPIPPLEAVYQLLSLNEWAALAAGCTILGGGLFAVFFLLPRRKWGRGLIRRAGLVLAIVAALSHLFAFSKYYQESYTSRGVIIAADAHPREAPNDGAPAAEFTLPPGTMIRVENAGIQGWIKAVYGGRNQVFIRRDQMEFL